MPAHDLAEPCPTVLVDADWSSTGASAARTRRRHSGLPQASGISSLIGRLPACDERMDENVHARASRRPAVGGSAAVFAPGLWSLPGSHGVIFTALDTVTWSMSETRTVARIVQVPASGRLRLSLPQ